MFTLRIDDDLSLELLEPRHAEPMFAVIEQSREHLRRWLGWVDGNTSVDATLAHIHDTQRQWAANAGYNVAILYQGELAGTIGHHSCNWSNRSSMIGYWLGAAFEGKGIMTRSCRALVDLSFAQMRLNRVDIRAATGNVHSQRIPERLGFVREGQVRDAEWLYDHYVDHYVYGMLARDWPQAQEGR